MASSLCFLLEHLAGQLAPALTSACAWRLRLRSWVVCVAGMKWMQYIVSLAALAGIVTALTVGLFSLSRIVMAASRDWLLPPFLARISPRTQTPLMAQMVFGLIIGALCCAELVRSEPHEE